MKKVLFIDRDGTLIIEPPKDFQVDSLEKLEFYPGVFTNLAKIARELDYVLVMVTNQDGLGTPSFPLESFNIPHQKMLQALKNEGVVFEDIYIDKSFENEQLPTRKPAKPQRSPKPRWRPNLAGPNPYAAARPQRSYCPAARRPIIDHWPIGYGYLGRSGPNLAGTRYRRFSCLSLYKRYLLRGRG